MFFRRINKFSFDFGRISGKMEETSKIWAISGVLRRGVGIPRNNVDPFQGVVEREDLASLGYVERRATPRHSTVHNMENFGVLCCFVFLLL